MKVMISTLPSGLRVLTAQMLDFDSAFVGAYINSGSRHENKNENGIAHFIEHMAFKGTKRRTARQISSDVEILGSNINAFTSKQRTAYYVVGHKKDVNISCDIIGDVLTNSIYAQEDIDLERKVILNEINQYEDNPSSIVYDAFMASIYPNHSLGRNILGTKETVSSFTRNDFLTFINNFYVTNNIVVCGVGNIDHDDFVKSVEVSFKNLKKGNANINENIPEWNKNGFALTKTNKFEQSAIMLGWQSSGANDPKIHAQKLFSMAIGNGASSPLFYEIREQRGLVYTTSCQTDIGVDNGNLNFFALTMPKNIEEVLNLTCDIARNSKNKISDTDITRAMNQYLMALAIVKESPSKMASYLISKLLTYDKIILPNEEREIIEKITKDEIMETTSLFHQSPTLSLVGDYPDIDFESIIKF